MQTFMIILNIVLTVAVNALFFYMGYRTGKIKTETKVIQGLSVSCDKGIAILEKMKGNITPESLEDDKLLLEYARGRRDTENDIYNIVK